jgi:hypothetical protein
MRDTLIIEKSENGFGTCIPDITFHLERREF